MKLLFLLMSLGILTGLLQAAPRLSDVRICDVTSKAARIVAHVNEPAVPDLKVFTDAAGTVLATGVEIISFPGFDDPGKSYAISRGLAYMEVRNLNPGTSYFLRLQVSSIEDNSEGRSNLLPVKTAIALTPFLAGAVKTHLANPVLQFHCVDAEGGGPADGSVLLAEIPGARAPISVSVLGQTDSYLETGNLVSQGTGQSLAFTGNAPLTLSLYRGNDDLVVYRLYTPSTRNLAELVVPRLTVGPLDQPVIRISQGASQIFLEFPAEDGKLYRLESSDTLQTDTWEVAGGAQRTEGGRLFWSDYPGALLAPAPADTPRRFYRIREIEE
jgi:hypothetical protein